MTTDEMREHANSIHKLLEDMAPDSIRAGLIVQAIWIIGAEICQRLEDISDPISPIGD